MRALDDYLTKPFGVGELLARIRVVLRRSPQTGVGPRETVFSMGNITVVLEKRRVFRGAEEVHLTPIEYKLSQNMVGKRVCTTGVLSSIARNC